MKIHGLAYILIGAFLIGFSYFITNISDKIDVQKFMLFIWLGVAFILFGAVRIFIGRKPKIAKENFPHHRPKHQVQHQHPARNQQQAQHPNQLVKFCSGCGNAVRHFDNFCYRCGSRIFHRR